MKARSTAVLHYIKSVFFEALDIPPRHNWSLSRRSGVVYLGGRAYTVAEDRDGHAYIRKVFCRSHDARASFQKELVAYARFEPYEWSTRKLATGTSWLGQPWILCNRYDQDQRLDRAVRRLSESEREDIALDALSIVLDMHSFRIAHRDFHAKHLFVTDRGLKVIDFDSSTEYPDDYHPDFDVCYDLTGQGLDCPPGTGNMGYFAENKWSVGAVMNVTKAPLLNRLKERVDAELEQLMLEKTDGPWFTRTTVSDPHAFALQTGLNTDQCVDWDGVLGAGACNDRSILVIGNHPFKRLVQLIRDTHITADWIAAPDAARTLRRWAGIHGLSKRMRFPDPSSDRIPRSQSTGYDFVVVLDDAQADWQQRGIAWDIPPSTPVFARLNR